MNGLDLFSGIGGLTLALRGRVIPVAYCENDGYAQAVLLSRMRDGSIPTAPIWDDVCTLRGEIISEIAERGAERNSMAGTLKKLTQEQVNLAAEWYQAGSSLADLAHEFGVSRQSMHDLLKRRVALRPQLRFGTSNHFYRGGARADKYAHNLVEDAIERGRLVNPGTCSNCGNMGRFKDGRTAIQGHHDDYNKPLRVRWMCQKCHHEWHKHNQPVRREEPSGSSENKIDIIYGGFP